MIDIIEKIMIGHRDISEKKELIERFFRARNDGDLPAIVEFFRKDMREHFRLEEEILFPVVREAADKEADEMIRQMLFAHKDMQQRMNELLRLADGIGDHDDLPQWHKKISDLAVRLFQDVLDHARQEDNGILAWVRQHFGLREQASLERRYFSYIRATPDDLR